jgi:hypothetical protein
VVWEVWEYSGIGKTSTTVGNKVAVILAPPLEDTALRVTITALMAPSDESCVLCSWLSKLVLQMYKNQGEVMKCQVGYGQASPDGITVYTTQDRLLGWTKSASGRTARHPKLLMWSTDPGRTFLLNQHASTAGLHATQMWSTDPGTIFVALSKRVCGRTARHASNVINRSRDYFLLNQNVPAAGLHATTHLY